MKYVVRDPQGNPHEVEAPEGASDAELISLAQSKTPAPEVTAPTQETPKEPSIPLPPPLWLGKQFTDLLEKGAYNLGGMATDAAAKFLPPEAAGAVGYGTNLAAQTATTLLGSGAGKAVEPIAKSQAAKLMQSALKPNVKQDLMQGKSAKAIDYMLEHGIPVSEGGITKLQQHINKLRGEIGQLVQNSTGMVDKNTVARELQTTLDKFAKTANPQQSLKTIAEAWQNFVNHPMLSGNTMPVQLAQEIKQGTNAVLRKSYGEMRGAEIEAQKGLVRGLRQEIEKIIPGIDKLNAKEGAAMDAKLLSEIRLHGELNKDPGGFGWMVAANNPQMALGWLAARSSYIKSLIARGLYKGAPTAGAAAGAAYGSTEAE
jgi:hypothetical protein